MLIQSHFSFKQFLKAEYNESPRYETHQNVSWMFPYIEVVAEELVSLVFVGFVQLELGQCQGAVPRDGPYAWT